MALVNSGLGIEKWNETELAKGGYYVYAWCCSDWGHIYYYVGKGHGDRYRITKGRGRAFTTIFDKWGVYPVILIGGLSEDEAWRLEDYYKSHFIFERGYPIMDGEGNHSALKNRAITIRKNELRERGELKDGRPRKETPEFEKFLKKQKEGKMSVAECCEQLGISRRTWYNRVAEIIA